MWNKDEVEGKTDQLKGRAKQAAGDIAGDDRLKEEGAADEASGGVQEAFGKGKREVGNAVKDLGNQIKK
jgi:uncharacterized protein YjbJ (UPF0337 family)